MTWIEICDDKNLQDLPYKIETNRWGQIVMSPARWEHGFYQGLLTELRCQRLPLWKPLVECPIETLQGVKVPDVAFCSPQFFDKISRGASLTVAPEICIEVLSSSNRDEEIDEKKSLYYQLGAQEVWLCSESGPLRFFSVNGPLSRSQICATFPSQIG